MAANVDLHNRKITYLRVSVTDRCNLRCRYCVPTHRFRFLDHSDILTFEEIVRIIEGAITMGFRKVRFTGGDPLVRKGFVDLARVVCRLDGLEDVSLTTNGVLLKHWARPIFEAGIHRINISLDTLNPFRFKKISGRDALADVLAGIEEARAVGFSPIRINVVMIKGINDDELEQLAEISVKDDFQVRFIEYMPVGDDNLWTQDQFISVGTLKKRLESTSRPLLPVPRSPLDGPVERYRFKDAKGEIGLISPLTRHFCPACNRLRLTADGKLRPCLFNSPEIDVRTPLRKGAHKEDIQRLIKQAIDKKPKQHFASTDAQGESRPMTAIGG